MRRNDEVAPDDARRVRRRPALARSGHAGATPASASTWCATLGGVVPDLRRLPRPPGDRRGVRRDRRPRPGAAARQDEPRAPRRRRRARRPARPVHRDALPLARDRPGDRAGRARGHRAHRLRRDHGRAPPHAAVEGVQFHPESVLTEGGHRHARQLARGVRRRRTRVARAARASAPVVGAPARRRLDARDDAGRPAARDGARRSGSSGCTSAWARASAWAVGVGRRGGRRGRRRRPWRP